MRPRLVLVYQAQPYIGTGAARILGEADAAVGQKLRRLDLLDGQVDQVAELPALVIGDGGAQVLDFDQALANEYTCATSWIPVIQSYGVSLE